ncbi:MAG: TVP38/TMEM64 family protein [Muricomes sp.]
MVNKKVIAFAGIIILVLVLNSIFGWSSYLSDADNLAFLEQLVKDNIWLAAGLYTVITIVGCVVLALPGVTFAILAGILFGPWLGTICCSLATTIGAAFAFLAGRFFLKESIKPVAMKNKYLKKMLFDESGKNEIFILMITRLVPLFPFNLQNFAYGVTDIKFSTYFLFSFVFMIPGTAMYTFGTAGLVDKENRWIYIGMAVLLAAAVIGLGKFFQKKYVAADEGEKQSEI